LLVGIVIADYNQFVTAY